LALEALFFYAFAAAAVVASLLVIGQRNPMHSVMLLIASFAALAALYVLLDAPFVAVIQIIIYTGAILVLFLFVVMLLNAPQEDVPEDAGRRIRVHGPRRLGAVLAGVLALELVWAVWAAFGPRGAPAFAQGERVTEAVSSVRRIGQVLFTDYAFAFEVTSLLIIVAMIGAVILAKRRSDAGSG
jgi:NADH-quinone oxidoreductase subunit J